RLPGADAGAPCGAAGRPRRAAGDPAARFGAGARARRGDAGGGARGGRARPRAGAHRGGVVSAVEAGSSGRLPESWRVQLPTFEGPLDLLLHLIKINEVEITDIPVATICDQFHEYLGLMEELDLDI